MMSISKIFRAAALSVAPASVPAVLSFVYPVTPAAAFGMDGGAQSVGVGVSMGGSAMTANGGNASYAHGSPAASNPTVAVMEARQRDAQVATEIDRARQAAKNVHAVDADLRRREAALASSHADQAMVHFDHAESDMEVHASSTEMGSYTRSTFGSVAAGGVELSGAVVH